MAGPAIMGPVVVSAVLSAPAPVRERLAEPEEDVRPDVPWVTIVWNDPVNLMSYVAYVFRTYFGYPDEKAERLPAALPGEVIRIG